MSRWCRLKMPDKYIPVEITALQWNRVLRTIRMLGGRCAIPQLAAELGVTRDDPAFQKSLDYLVEQGRIFVSMGVWNHTVCRYVHSTNEQHYFNQ